MTGVTICRSVLVTVCVASDTGQRHVSSGKRELGLTMVELRRRPGSSIMAFGTIVAEIIAHMIRVLHPVEIGGMARVAVCRGILVSAGVALHASQIGMRAGERELGLRMIELSR